MTLLLFFFYSEGLKEKKSDKDKFIKAHLKILKNVTYFNRFLFLAGRIS